MDNNQSQKFFLYARKSTDVEERQILSIEAQITELHAFAKQNNLNVVETFIEKQGLRDNSGAYFFNIWQIILFRLFLFWPR